jgi:hypothetical protein
MAILLYTRRSHGSAEGLETLAPATVAGIDELVHPDGDHLRSKLKYTTPCDKTDSSWPVEHNHKSELLKANAQLGVPHAARAVVIADAIQMNPNDVLLSAFTCMAKAPRKRAWRCSFSGVAEFEDDDSMASSETDDEDLLETPRFKKRPAVLRPAASSAHFAAEKSTS